MLLIFWWSVATGMAVFASIVTLYMAHLGLFVSGHRGEEFEFVIPLLMTVLLGYTSYTNYPWW